MYDDIIREQSTLTYKELGPLKSSVDNEINYRESLEPIAWECPGCGFSAPSWAEVINHAQKEHNLESTGMGYGISYPPKAVYP